MTASHDLVQKGRSGPRPASTTGTPSGTLTRLSGGVTKPTSRHNSPQHSQRRRPAAQSKVRPSLDPLSTGWHAPGSFGHQESVAVHDPLARPLRPYSWHHVQEDTNDFAASPWENEQPYLDASFPPLFGPSNDMPLPYAPQQSAMDSRSASNLQYVNDSAYVYDPFTSGQVSIPVFNADAYFVSQPIFPDGSIPFQQPAYTMGYSQGSMPESQHLQSDPFRPFEHFGSSMPKAPLGSLKTKDDGEELVGMGLYDDARDMSACDPQSDAYQTLLLGAVGKGKGLKLEEAFVPDEDAASSEADDSEYEEDEAADDDAEELALQAPVLSQDYHFSQSNNTSPVEQDLPAFTFEHQQQHYVASDWTDQQLLSSFTPEDMHAASVLGQTAHFYPVR